jgi:hypothetical protein
LKENGIKNEEVAGIIYELSIRLDKRNLAKHLINYNWQLALLEREKIKDAILKFDKVEIKLQINSSSNGQIKQDILRMNYYEFSEIFQNLKSIDSQLHLFKN